MNNSQGKEYCEITNELFDLCDRKSKDYSDDMIEAGQVDNISALGIPGLYVRMSDKMARLHKMMWLNKTNEVKEEGLEDALKDLANYCIISLMVLRNKWKNC